MSTIKAHCPTEGDVEVDGTAVWLIAAPGGRWSYAWWCACQEVHEKPADAAIRSLLELAAGVRVIDIESDDEMRDAMRRPVLPTLREIDVNKWAALLLTMPDTLDLLVHIPKAVHEWARGEALRNAAARARLE